MIGTKIYAVGGEQFGVAVTNNQVYDPATDSWDASPARLPITSGGLAVAALHGRLYAFGGEFFEDGMAGVYDLSAEYDPETDSWRNLAPMPVKRYWTGQNIPSDCRNQLQCPKALA